MATLKKHLSLSEQVALLSSRGLYISNGPAAERLLLDTNYYRLSGYLHDFKVQGAEKYIDNLSLDHIKHLYDFDRRLGRIIMYALEDVEETLKSRISYTVTESNPDDPLVYLNPAIYTSQDEYNTFKDKFRTLVENNSKLPFVKHHMTKYNGDMPMWVAVELLTMGNLSALYKNLVPAYKKKIARLYNTGPDQLENWIRNLTYTRNHLAHYMRIYNFNFGRTPKTCKKHIQTQYTSNKIFDQICVASIMYSDPVEWNSYVQNEIWSILDEYKDDITLSAIGFPNNWQTLLTLPVKGLDYVIT